MHKFINELLKKKGYTIYKDGITDKTSIIYSKILNVNNIENILDIGANAGQYAQSLRKMGYKEHIYSFEPLKQPYTALVSNSKDDNKWHVFNYGLGDAPGKQQIHVSKNSVSSSIRDIKQEHIQNEPDSVYTHTTEIELKTLDEVLLELKVKDLTKTMIKIDTQGFEENVLKGASTSLGKIPLIQLELSLIPLYEEALLFEEMLMYMKANGYYLYNIFPAFQSFNTGQLLQADALFAKNK